MSARSFFRALCLGLLIALALGGGAHAAPGDGRPDPRFSRDGRRTVNFDERDFARGVVVRRDGKIYVIGGGGTRRDEDYRVTVTRILPGGTLDRRFGGDGKVRSDLSRSQDYGVSGMLQRSGKLVVLADRVDDAGFSQGYTLVRYNGDGRIDRSFGTRGTVSGSFGDGREVGPGLGTSAAARHGAKILVLGYNDGRALLHRYTTEGVPDNSFGTRGRASSGRFRFEFATALSVQPDGKVLVAGDAMLRGGVPALVVVRFNANGALDRTFGRGGGVVSRMPRSELVIADDVTVQRDGRVVVAGTYYRYAENQFGYTTDFMLVRYKPGGRADLRFGWGGMSLTNVGASDAARSVLRLPGGKLAVVGYSGEQRGEGALRPILRPPSTPSLAPRALSPRSAVRGAPGDYLNFTLLRFNPNGALDRGWGERGVLTTRFNGLSAAFAGARQRDGRIVAVGVAQGKEGPRSREFAVARYRER